MKIEKVNLAQKFNTFLDFWNPRIVGRLNQQLVKIAKFKGDFINHKHDGEDELFMVIEGKIFIELENQTLELEKGEMVIIPKGVMHKPYAPEEAQVMMFEPASTVNTGEIENDLTIKNLEEI